MQNVQRIKRQNCGNTLHGNHSLIFGSRDQIGSRFAVANGEAEGSMNHSPRTMSGRCYGLTDQGNRKLHDRNFQSGPAEAGSSSSSGFPSYDGSLFRISASETESLHYPTSGSFMSSPHPQSCIGSRSSCKRKSSMDDVIGSVGSLTFRPFSEGRENDHPKFTEEAGTSRADSVFPPASSDPVSTLRPPVLDDLPYPGENSMMYQTSRPRSSHHLQVGSNRYYGGHLNGSQELCQAPFIQNNRVSSDILSSHMWMSRGTLSNEHTMQSTRNLHDFSPFNQSNAPSAVVPWCGHGSVSGEGMDHPNFHRNFNAGVNIGFRTRNFSNGASLWMGVPPWTQNTFEPSSRVLPGFPYRESALQGSHMAPVRHLYAGSVASSHPLATPLTGQNSFYSQGGLLPYPPASHAATGSIILGSQAAPGNAYPSFGFFNRSAMSPPFLGSAESGGASPFHNFYGMPFQGLEISPAQRGSGQRLPSHEMFDHAMVNNELDIHDQHIGLQLDVDNMSYEELLALEERIGNVNTGLSEENICKCLKTSKHSSYDMMASAVSQESEIKCSICQEEYMEGDELGQLDCSHSYHTACIKQWLVLKNQCPICKAAAFSLS
eukprot:c22640_g2_i1 orf=410-2218(-)